MEISILYRIETILKVSIPRNMFIWGASDQSLLLGMNTSKNEMVRYVAIPMKLFSMLKVVYCIITI